MQITKVNKDSIIDTLKEKSFLKFVHSQYLKSDMIRFYDNYNSIIDDL